MKKNEENNTTINCFENFEPITFVVGIISHQPTTMSE